MVEHRNCGGEVFKRPDGSFECGKCGKTVNAYDHIEVLFDIRPLSAKESVVSQLSESPMTYDETETFTSSDGQTATVKGKWCGDVFYLEGGGAIVDDGRTERLKRPRSNPPAPTLDHSTTESER